MADRIIALDIGEKRIGVAIADMQTPFPAPLTTLETSNQLLEEFKQLVEKNAVVAVVVGLPRNQSGEFTEQTKRVQHIAKLLKIPKHIPVYWQDESLTSVKAEEELKRRKRPYDKAAVDALAATYILEDFIRTQGSPEVAPHPEKHKTNAKKKPAKAKKKKSPKKRMLMAVAGLLVAAAVLAVSAVGWYLYALSPRTSSDQFAVIVVKSGMGAKDIAANLEEKQIIKSAFAFELYVRMNGITGLQAGEYRLSSKQSVQTIADIIAGGKVTAMNIQILPGKTLDEIFTSLEKDGYSKADLNAALLAVRDHPVLRAVPQGMKLEGYLFPDTYQVAPSTSAEQLMRQMLDNFQKKMAEDSTISKGLTAQGLTFSQAVTVASIVQKEVRGYEDQQKVAQVFLRRLREGIPLGADPTFKYAAAHEGGSADPSNNSRYNTRKYAGLPPSAIGNFNISALKAVANPSATYYLYFVAGDDGTTHFSATLEEHEALTQKYCTILCR